MSVRSPRAPTGAALWLALAGCPADDPATSGETDASTSVASTSTSTTLGEESTSESSGGVAESSSESSTGAPLQRCGIEDLAPGATNPLVASDAEAMQLPTEIADILTRSCGCHLADDIVIPGDYPSTGRLDLTTWAGWQVDFGSVPTYEAARRRLDPENPLVIMPPHQCDVGGGETMLPEDRARLLEWIAALAPDGTTWSMR